MTFTNWRFTCLPLKSAGVQHRQGIQQTTFLWNGGFRLSRWYDFFLDFVNNVNSVVLIFVTETISRTDEGQPKMKYIFNKCGTSIYFFYSTGVWSITITEFKKLTPLQYCIYILGLVHHLNPCNGSNNH